MIFARRQHHASCKNQDWTSNNLRFIFFLPHQITGVVFCLFLPWILCYRFWNLICAKIKSTSNTTGTRSLCFASGSNMTVLNYFQRFGSYLIVDTPAKGFTPLHWHENSTRCIDVVLYWMTKSFHISWLINPSIHSRSSGRNPELLALLTGLWMSPWQILKSPARRLGLFFLSF